MGPVAALAKLFLLSSTLLSHSPLHPVSLPSQCLGAPTLPLNPSRGSVKALKAHSRSGEEPATKRFLVYFVLKFDNVPIGFGDRFRFI